MRRFTEVLLLAAYTPLLFSFANGLHAMQSTVKHNALQKSGAIRGLLDTRQSSTFCPNGGFICETEFCCDPGWHCCADGSCCFPDTYCVLGSNGVVGCCPNGELCSGPVGGPQTIPQDPTTIFSTSTSTERFTATSTSTSTSEFTSTTASTTTLTTIPGGPTQAVGQTITEISVLDVDVTWSKNWVQGPSSCNRSDTSKSTTTVNSSFTYIFPDGQADNITFYFDVVNRFTKWLVSVNGAPERVFTSVFDMSNCTIEDVLNLPIRFPALSYNLTVTVQGWDGVLPPLSSTPPEWSFEFNKLLIQAPTPSSTSTTLSSLTQTPTGSALTAWAGRAQPYRPLLVFSGILSALLYCA